MLDIDFFKRVNDTHGHGGGDRALVAFAEACLTTLRKTDLMGRIGGEEFAILLPETSLEAGREIGERLRRSVEACTILSEGARFGITVSLGLAELNPGDESFDALLKRADGALYEAKHQGRNRLVHSG
jgi:diguanylate cyclase (GGDEF)-like protein